MNIRKTLRSLHRDFGYLVVGITFIYTVSGIALNHRTDWNPHYTLVTEDLAVSPEQKAAFSKEEIQTLIGKFDYQPVYKKHFTTKDSLIKIFVEEGTVVYNPGKGMASLEILKKRPFFFQINNKGFLTVLCAGGHLKHTHAQAQALVNGSHPAGIPAG